MSDIDEIRARHQAGERASADADREWLLGEVERLTHERDEERRAVQLAVEKLVSEVERQARHIDELQEKIDAEKSCACSYDAPGDVCSTHSPALVAARAEIERLRTGLEWYADSVSAFQKAAREDEFSELFDDGGQRARAVLRIEEGGR